jgi:hypothetical protein
MAHDLYPDRQVDVEPSDGDNNGGKSLLAMTLKVKEPLQLSRLLPTRSVPAWWGKPTLQLPIGLTPLSL